MAIPAHVSTDREICLSLPVEAPHQWTAETPYLYSLKVELLEKEAVTHTRMERVGFRQISTDGGVFRINGQEVKLRGVNRHDEHPDVGRATTRKQWLEDLTLMKAANINYLRLSHYTPAEGFIAVSYTHLDVYKRQKDRMPEHIIRIRTGWLWSLSDVGMICGVSVPEQAGVSIQEDVYKRQTGCTLSMA